MNIFEMLSVLIVVAFAIAGARLGWHWYHYVGGILGLMLGTLMPISTVNSVSAIIKWWVPRYPPCMCGKSTRGSFEFLRWLKDEKGSVTSRMYICRECGRKYCKSKRHVEFIPEENVKVPYMSHSMFGRWHLDR